MALAVENASSAEFSSTNTGTIAFATSGADRIAVLCIGFEATNAQGAQTVSGITDNSGLGLTWTRRKQLTWTHGVGSTKQCLETWWAYVPTTVTGKLITITLTGTIDDESAVYFAVSGADVATPWDTNGSLPATATDVTGSFTTPTVTGVSTTAANALIFGFFSSDFNTQPGVQGAGFTFIAQHYNHGAVNFCIVCAEYVVESTVQSGLTVAFGNGETNWGCVADAIKAPVAALPTSYAVIVG